MTNSTKSFFNPHLYQYLGGVPETYNNPNVLTSPLLQNGAVFFSASSVVAATAPSNAALTSPPPMAIPGASATFQHGTFYNSPLPSPPLSCSGSPRSSCAMFSTGSPGSSCAIPCSGSPGSSCSVSDLDSIHKNNPQISNPNNFSCLPDVSLIPNIPLQQLVDSSLFLLLTTQFQLTYRHRPTTRGVRPFLNSNRLYLTISTQWRNLLPPVKFPNLLKMFLRF